MTRLSKKLGQRIREIRKRQGMQQIQLAEIIEMEPSNLCKLENGGQLPKEENIEKIAKALNVEIKELFDFGHMSSKEELIKNLTDILKKSSKNQLELYYKLISSCQEYES